MKVSINYHVDKDDGFSSMMVSSVEGREPFVCLSDQGRGLNIFFQKEDKSALKSLIGAANGALTKLDEISEELTCQTLDKG